MQNTKRYKLSVPGDFYVANGECIACSLPASESPNLIGEDESEGNYHCYFKRQPVTKSEINDAIDAMDVSCCGALRYCGNDSEIIKKLLDRNLKDQIDV